jgi:hypothetical protein
MALASRDWRAVDNACIGRHVVGSVHQARGSEGLEVGSLFLVNGIAFASIGYWKQGRSNQGSCSNIKVRDFFDNNGGIFQVLEVNDTSIVAKLFFTRALLHTFHDRSAVACAIAQKGGVEEIYDKKLFTIE